MANFLGFNITKSAPRIRVEGTEFAARTALRQEILAKAPFLPSNQISNDSQVNYVNALPPFNKNPPKTALPSISADLEERAINTDPRELWYLALPNKLTPQQCLTLLRAALGGDLWQQWQLLSLMLDTWPTFRMASHQLREAAAYARYVVHPFAEEGEEPSKEAKEKAAMVNRAFRSMEPNPMNDEKGFTSMIYDFTDAVLDGLSLEEIMWEERTTKKHGFEVMPRAAAWVHPRHFTFSNQGNLAVFDDQYARLYANPKLLNNGIKGQSPDPNKFITSQFISRSGSVLGAGFMRPLVWYWAARQFNNEWMLNTAKQYGSPFIDITFKVGTPLNELQALDAMLKNAAPERRLRRPEGTTATIVPPTTMGADNPQRYIAEEADKQCLFLLLGQSGTTMPTAGALGNQDTHKEVSEEKMIGVAKWVAHNPLRQLARAILRLNYGNCDECPNIEPDFTHPLSSQEVGQFATALTSSQLPFRADEVYKKLGLSLPEEGDIVIQKGEIKINGAPMTDEEKQEQQMQQQQAQMEMQQGVQQDADGGEEQEGEEEEPEEEPEDVQASQRRAKIGGEFGANGEWYEGGKWIANTDEAKKHKPTYRATGKQEIGPYKWEVAPSPQHIAIYPSLGGIEKYDRENDKFSFNENMKEDFATPEAIEERKAQIESYNRGERWRVLPPPVDLTQATDADLVELEALVQAAEVAGNKGEEMIALNDKLKELETR